MDAYRNDNSSYVTCCEVEKEFLKWSQSITDDPKKKPSARDDAATKNKVEHFIVLDRIPTIQRIINDTHLSYGSVRKIIH